MLFCISIGNSDYNIIINNSATSTNVFKHNKQLKELSKKNQIAWLPKVSFNMEKLSARCMWRKRNRLWQETLSEETGFNSQL